MAKEIKITARRLKELNERLEYLTTTREREIAQMLEEARSYGDLSENFEYTAAKNEQEKNNRSIAEIQYILSRAVLIEDEYADTGRVGLGCKVVVEDATGNPTISILTGSTEANPMLFRVSDDCPFGRAIVGKAPGESFTFNAPAGSFTMKVVDVFRENEE